MDRRADRCFRLVAIVSLAIVTLLGSPSLGQERDSLDEERDEGADCAATSIGATPLIDLTEGRYHGEEGGLYPGASNSMPQEHRTLGLLQAAEVVPRISTGAPGSDGAIGFLSVGVSNTFREFETFTQMVSGHEALETDIVFINGAQGGAALSRWADSESGVWDDLDAVVERAALSPLQVQVAWVKMVARIDDANPAQPFPEDALTYQEDLEAALRVLKERFPNLAIAYLSSRIYGGYNTATSPSPEPWAYQQGFGVKWTIEAQIEGDPELAAPIGDEAAAPWTAWGPYLWADGERPRSDGLTWECRDMRGDGVHPSRRGQEKVGEMLITFLRQEPTAAWMWSDRDLEAPPAITEPVESTQVTASTTTATIQPPATAASTEPASPSITAEPKNRSTATDTGLVWSAVIAALVGVTWGGGLFVRRHRRRR